LQHSTSNPQQKANSINFHILVGPAVAVFLQRSWQLCPEDYKFSGEKTPIIQSLG